MYYSSSQSRSLELRRPQSESKNVYAALGLETDVKNKSSSSSHQRQQNDNSSPKRISNWSFKLLLIFSILFYLSDHVLKVMNKISSTYQNVTFTNEDIDQSRPSSKSEDRGNLFQKYHDVIMDLPVSDTDVPVLWGYPGSDNEGIKNLYSGCFDIEIDTYDVSEESIFDFSSHGRLKGFYSSEIKDLDSLWTKNQQGRMFSFFRHPFHAYLDQIAQDVTPTSDLMTRHLVQNFDKPLTLMELGVAKRMVRERMVVGLLDENIHESIQRIADYYGWKAMRGEPCILKYLESISPDQFKEMMHDNSEQWDKFLEINKFDLQVYEFARSVFRGQKQTIISLDKQYALQESEEE